LDKLMPLVYDELRQMAKRHMDRQQAGDTLQTTALIHEAYLRLVDQSEAQWQNRAHFFAVAATAMRHILVDHARARQAAKRGGVARAVTLDEAAAVSVERAAELVALDDALESLAAFDQRKSRVVEMRYFGGLTVEETAEALRVSPETVARDWRLARTWLLRELSKTEVSGE
jgi:RNA polymerase sigma factor (TIGR02999 family)